MNISFTYHDSFYKCFDEEKVKIWIVNTIKEENKKLGKILYEFISDDEILKINNEFLGHNYYTDVITFDESLVNIIKGHIFISIESVLSFSKDNNLDFTVEIYRVIIHGIMHLCGYSDYNLEQKRMMRIKENYYLDKL